MSWNGLRRRRKCRAILAPQLWTFATGELHSVAGCTRTQKPRDWRVMMDNHRGAWLTLPFAWASERRSDIYSQQGGPGDARFS